MAPYLVLRGYGVSAAKHLLLCSERLRSRAVVSGWTLDSGLLIRDGWLLNHQPLSDSGKYKLEISMTKLINLCRNVSIVTCFPGGIEGQEDELAVWIHRVSGP